MAKLSEVKFSNGRFSTNEEAREFVETLMGALGPTFVANTLRTVLRARQKQNKLMEFARKALKEEDLAKMK